MQNKRQSAKENTQQTRYLAIALAAALEISLSSIAQSTQSQAANASNLAANQNPANYPTTSSMEKCIIVGPDGRGLIKEGMADCAYENQQSCSGHNEPGDASAWIYIPAGICSKIRGGSVLR